MDTQQLVQECNSGCKMAIYSMNQVIEYVGDEKLKKLIEKYKYSHENLEEESSELLKQMGKGEKIRVWWQPHFPGCLQRQS